MILAAFFYPQENEGSIAYLKAGAMGGRLTNVNDIAPLIRFLCTEGAWINGQTIFANGGFSTR
jgi:NAD(P)-dependent dehydrogenase (short-subunit alcohol dehydrogenase family)